MYTYRVSVQNRIAFRPHWPNFGPLVATKRLRMVVSDHYLKKYSRHPIQTWCKHLLGEYSKSVPSGPRRSNFGPLVAQNAWKWWFPTVIWKRIHTIQFKLGVYTCLVSVHKWFGFGPRWLNFGPLVVKKLMKLGENGRSHWCVHLLVEWFLTIIWGKYS